MKPREVAKHLRSTLATEDEMTEVLAALVYESRREGRREALNELLPAFKEVLALSDRKHNAWDSARAVIAKVEKE